jgi:hypothetical protein
MVDAISKRNSVARRRSKLRAMGLRPLQLWVPDTRAPGFAAQVAHDIALASAPETPAEQALSDAWEHAGWADLPEWTGPDLTQPTDRT